VVICKGVIVAEILSQNEIDGLLNSVSNMRFEYTNIFKTKSNCIDCKYKTDIENEYSQLVEENRHLKELLKIYLR